MWDFTNDVALKFDVVSVALSVCVMCGGGGGSGGHLGFVGMHFSDWYG